MIHQLETQKIIFATQNEAKLRRFDSIIASLFFNSEELGLDASSNKELPYPEEGLNEHTNAVNKALHVFTEHGASVPVLATDDGIRFTSLPEASPGAEVKRVLSDQASLEEIFNYYNELAKENSDIQAVLLRTIALATSNGLYQTWVEIPCTLVSRDQMPENLTQNPLDHLLVPQGFSVPFADMSQEEVTSYDQKFTGPALESIFFNWQKVAKEGYVSTTSMSLESVNNTNATEIVLPPGFRFAQQEDSRKIAEMSGALAKFYGGRQNGDWVMEKYGNVGIDKTGFFSETKGLIVAGPVGDPTAMLAIIGKRGGSMKTNTLIVSEESRGQGLGRKIKEVAIQFARAAEMRKVYCTTSVDNDNALGTNLALGYQIEASFPDQYKLGSLEVILGMPLIDLPNHDFYSDTEGMILRVENENRENVSYFDPNETTDEITEQIARLFKRLEKWHDGVGEGTTFVENTFAGASRGVEDIDGKGKLISYISGIDSEVTGVAVLTAKKGEPGKASAGKLYPLFGSSEAIVTLVAKNVEAAQQIGCTKLYTFAPVNDKDIHQVLEEAGFAAVKNPYLNPEIVSRVKELGYEVNEENVQEEFARLRSPYKQGEDLVPYELFITT